MVFVSASSVGAVGDLDFKAVCESTNAGYTWSVTSYIQSVQPFNWTRTQPNGIIVEKGMGVAQPNGATTEFTTGNSNGGTELHVGWNPTLGSTYDTNTAVAFQNCGQVIAPAPTIVPVPETPKPIVLTINNIGYVVKDNPVTVRDLHVKILWLMQQLFGF